MLALKKEGEREENSSLEHTSKIFFFKLENHSFSIDVVTSHMRYSLNQ